jgi:ABC-type nickel/cobalt efflux system permease component RcnA
MILKTLGKLLLVFFSMIGILAAAAIFVLILALIVRFKLLLAIAVVFVGLGYCITWTSGVQVKTNPRFRYVDGNSDVDSDERRSGLRVS